MARPTVVTRAVLGVAVLVVGAGCGTRVAPRFAALPTTGPSATASTATTGAVTSTSTTIDMAAAVSQITSTWKTFFDHTTALATREALLENGSSYAAALAAQAQNPLEAQATATVSSVHLTGPTQATVIYNVMLNGKIALQAAAGTAVLQDGTWKVSAQSFCSLATLGTSSPVPGCS